MSSATNSFLFDVLLCLLVISGATTFLDAFGLSRGYNACGGNACRFSLSCWVSGGQALPDANCDSVFHVCCRDGAVAEPRKINGWFPGSVGNAVEEPAPFPDGVLNERDCGKPKISRRRVVGGSSAGFGTFPWQALVRIRSSRCGGALVGIRHVVTAGHCVQQSLGPDLNAAGGAHVYLGEYSLNSQTEPLPRQRYSVEKIHLHPFYEFSPQADRYDVAVLKLSKPVRYDWHIQPVCLPDRGQEFEEGSAAMVAGWGATEADSTRRPKELQAVDVNLVSARLCKKWHEKNGIELEIFGDMLCAGHKDGGKDACQGDSGGPLMRRDGETGRWTLIGLVSAGYSCAKPGQPGIYHKVSKSADWISYVQQHL